MRVGLIAEGRGDLAVLTRVLRGALRIDADDVQALLPEFDLDETDLHTMRTEQFSNWVAVLDACRDRRRIRDFFEASQTDEDRILVVQIDTAECELTNYDVARPSPASPSALCQRVEMLLVGLMEGEFRSETCFAIAVEETEAWLLPFYDAISDSAAVPHAKERLDRAIARTNDLTDRDRARLGGLGEYPRMYELSRPLAKRKELDRSAKSNVSLARFIAELDAVVSQLPAR